MMSLISTLKGKIKLCSTYLSRTGAALSLIVKTDNVDIKAKLVVLY